jgi:hypothetical protein
MQRHVGTSMPNCRIQATSGAPSPAVNGSSEGTAKSRGACDRLSVAASGWLRWGACSVVPLAHLPCPGPSVGRCDKEGRKRPSRRYR